MEKLNFMFTDYTGNPEIDTPLSTDNLNKIINKLNECVDEINKIKEQALEFEVVDE